jgi:hypothetical protein
LKGKTYFISSRHYIENNKTYAAQLAEQGLNAFYIAERPTVYPDGNFLNLNDVTLPANKRFSRVCVMVEGQQILLAVQAARIRTENGSAWTLFYSPVKDGSERRNGSLLLYARAPLAVARWMKDNPGVLEELAFDPKQFKLDMFEPSVPPAAQSRRYLPSSPSGK